MSAPMTPDSLLNPSTAFPVVGAPVAVPVITPRPAVAVPSAQPAITLRVLHVINGEHFSGAERVQSHLGKCLPRWGVAADFACVKPGRFAEMLEQESGEGGRCFRTPMRHRFDLRAAWRIRDLAVREGFELLHAHTPRTAMITAVASQLTGIPWVYHVHSPAGRDSARAWINRLNAWIERCSLVRCSHLVTVSQSLREECLREGIDPRRVSVVHNGVPAIRPIRQRIPIAGGGWTLGMIALMRPRKGLEIAFDAVARLRTAGHDIALRCIGPFETAGYAAEIENRIERLGIADRVERIGFTDDVPAALAKLDALVLPSLYGEGLPMVVLESMAAAVPVIATRVEGTPEAIRDGIEGLLAEPRDAVSLADKIEALVTGRHDWTAMAEAAYRRHAESFSDLAMAQRLARVYSEVCPAAGLC